jgi:hypothetical protein
MPSVAPHHRENHKHCSIQCCHPCRFFLRHLNHRSCHLIILDSDFLNQHNNYGAFTSPPALEIRSVYESHSTDDQNNTRTDMSWGISVMHSDGKRSDKDNRDFYLISFYPFPPTSSSSECKPSIGLSLCGLFDLSLPHPFFSRRFVAT